MYTTFGKIKCVAFTLSLAGGLMAPAAFADHSHAETQARESTANAPQVSRAMVRQAQEQLKNRGFYNGPIDGNYGSETHKAVQKFQRSENIVESGNLNDATLKSLGVETARQESRGEASRSIDEGQANSGSSEHISQDLVRSAQRQLKRDGYYQGDVDGTMGPDTRHAIRQYQQDQKLRTTGQLNDQTLDSLGIHR